MLKKLDLITNKYVYVSARAISYIKKIEKQMCYPTGGCEWALICRGYEVRVDGRTFVFGNVTDLLKKAFQ